eukprot:TRINITY_DN291_c0_g2_i7.p2 TRINITY_DN291_c0_g2~~TRINITY_DN291_c0_g2_i7.p2  ORF type:complete len:597 (+),score=153.04 TRINITY_DN291_c0_g2_i7:107-1792(+)
MREFLRFLGFCALTGELIDSNVQVGEKPMLDVVASVGVFLKPAGDNLYKPVFPPCVLELLRSGPLNMSNLFGMLDVAEHRLPARTLDAGHTLTLHVAFALSRALKVVKSFAAVRGLRFVTELKEMVVHPAQGGKFDLNYVPSFAKANKVTYWDDTKREGPPAVHNFPAGSGWTAAVKYFHDNFSNVVGVPFDNNSKGPDLVISIAGEDNKALSCLLEAAVKNKWSKNGLSWDEIRKEVGKCVTAPREQGVKLPIVLCIIATQHNANVAAALPGGCTVCFTSGEWFGTPEGPLRKGKAKVPDKGKSKGKGKGKSKSKGEEKAESPVLIVPDNSYVVLLSKVDLTELLGEAAVEALEHAFSPKNITTENLQKLAQFTFSDMNISEKPTWVSPVNATWKRPHGEGGEEDVHQPPQKLVKQHVTSTAAAAAAAVSSPLDEEIERTAKMLPLKDRRCWRRLARQFGFLTDLKELSIGENVMTYLQGLQDQEKELQDQEKEVQDQVDRVLKILEAAASGPDARVRMEDVHVRLVLLRRALKPEQAVRLLRQAVDVPSALAVLAPFVP